MNTFFLIVISIWASYCFISEYFENKHNGWKEVLSNAFWKFFICPIVLTLHITIGSFVLFVMMGGYN